MKAIFKNGQTVVFQGDSITDCQHRNDNERHLGFGYASRVAKVYETLFPREKINFVNFGISGDTSKMMLDRYSEDFADVKPDFISILIGINDVWRRYDANSPTSCEDFHNNYETYLKKLKSDFPQAKIMIIEPYMLDSDEQKKCFHEDLDPKMFVVRDLAKKYADYYLPLDGIMNRYASTVYDCKTISNDGIHPTETGHGIIAYEYLKEIGSI